MTQSGGGGSEYSLGTATLTMRGDMQPLERDLARMRAVIAEMEKRGANIPAPNIPTPKPPPPETQRGYDGLLKTIEALRRGTQGDGEAFTMLAGQLRGAGQAAAAAGGSGGFGGAGAALGGLLGMAGKAIPGLAQLGLAATGVQAIFGGLQGAVNAVLAPLQQLSAEAGRLNKQVAEAGIFAAQSFAILGPDGKLVEGTARQMQMVRGAILKEYKGIQQEVANISGATASEIYDGFNIILQNISSLGEKGTLENSAKLATRMAAGMNTLGIPGFQLRQEVNALMMGNIDRNAMMATKLGITGEDVRQQQAQGTYYDFLMKKLEKLYEGQKVLALSLANVKSNFDDVNQAIASESGQPLERDTAQMMQTILVTFKNLQGSFTGFFRSIAEAVGPILKVLGPIVSMFTSIGAIASSVGRVIMDVFGLVTATFGKLLPLQTAVARIFELIARSVQLVAQIIGAVINPIKALFNVDTDTANAGVNDFFDNLSTGLDRVGSAIDAFSQKWSQLVLNVGLGKLRSSMKLKGKSDKEIQQAEIDYRERFKTQTGLTEPVSLRSLAPDVEKYLDDLNARLGSGAVRALNISKAWADIKQKAYQNEIKALEQGLTLMNKQKELAEAISAVATARRALEARGYELGAQVAASPEGKLAAEARLADLKLRQEKEAIAERKGILQTERELQQRQMMIQEKQIKIQQEQLKIQLAEAQADQVRVAEATKALLRVRGNTAPRSPEWQTITGQLNVLAAEGTRNVARITGAREALRLAFEAEGQQGTINSLEAQRLGLQEQQLDIQGQSAQYTREQQALLAQISAEEQKITNTLTRATTEQNRKKQALENQKEQINQQNTLLERQSRLEKAQAELATTRAKAQVQAAQRLAEIQELQDRARSGGGTASVIEAQIAAAAAGVSGMETAAQVQERLYQAKEQQMTREHALQQRQLEVQQKREQSELRIQRIQMESQRVAIALQRAQLAAEIARLTLKQQQDAIAPQLAGASSVPSLGAAVSTASMAGKGGAYLQGSIGPTSTGPHFDVKRVGGGFFPRTYLDQFVEVNGRPLSSGTTVAGGTFAGHQARGSHGWDYAFGDGRFAATLKGGAEWMDGIPTAHGERRRFRLPTGEVFQFLHGRSEGIGSAAAPVPVETRATAPVASTVAAAGGTVAPSTALQAQELQQRQQDLNDQDTRVNELLKGLKEWSDQLKDIFGLQKENLSEQQLAERAQFEFERVKAQLTAEVMKTPQGRLAIATGDAVSGSISSSVSGALQALLNGGDVKQAVSSALAQAGQSLMQATLDALLNPLLAQLQGGIVKTVTGIDIQGGALQAAAGSLQGAAGALTLAAQAWTAAAGVGGATSAGGDLFGSLAMKIPSLIGGLAGIGGIPNFAGAFSGGGSSLDFGAALNMPSLVSTTAAPSFAQAFTPGRAGGDEIQYGLDYLVGERNAEIVRFNKAGGRVFSNRALTKALGVPFQRSPGGGASVAGGDSMSGGGSSIPFLKAQGGSGSGISLAPGRTSALRLSVDTQVINRVEYATVEQVWQAAQAGRDSVYNDLRNNPSVQRSLGMGG